jgi:hypothetical protein
MKTLIACSLMLTAVVGAAAQMPQPGPEHKRLERFVGTWKMEGKMNPSPLGPGGAFSGTETCRLFEGGFHVVCDSEGTGAMGPMKGHMMLSYDRGAKVYRYASIHNGPDGDVATGTVSGNTWTWKSEPTVEGGKKIWSQFVLVEKSPTVHTMTWSMSDDGKKWMTVMEGTSTKQ